jgi:predicted transcriptional regulator
MATPNTPQQDTLIPKTLLKRLEVEAKRRNTSVKKLVKQAVEEYLDEPETEDTPKEKILADLEQAFLDIKAGRTTPAEEALARIRAKRTNNGAHQD